MVDRITYVTIQVREAMELNPYTVQEIIERTQKIDPNIKPWEVYGVLGRMLGVEITLTEDRKWQRHERAESACPTTGH